MLTIICWKSAGEKIKFTRIISYGTILLLRTWKKNFSASNGIIMKENLLIITPIQNVLK